MSDDMKRELNGVKLRLDHVETRLDGVETRLGGVETRLGGVETKVESLEVVVKRMASEITKVAYRMEEGFKRTATKDDISMLKGSIEGLAGKVDDMRLDWSKRHDRLNDHDRRLTRLEERRP